MACGVGRDVAERGSKNTFPEEFVGEGVPEGTLASRLDATRKRLADRLARRRVPLAFGALLVPVPAELAAAAVERATDGAGVVIHQLADEVTRAMFPKTKWAALAAVVVPATAVGGLVLAASAGDAPVARQDPPAASSPAPVPNKPAPAPNQEAKPPEPAWQKAFHAAYRLADGRYVKRVAPPYVPEQGEFYLCGSTARTWT